MVFSVIHNVIQGLRATEICSDWLTFSLLTYLLSPLPAPLWRRKGRGTREDSLTGCDAILEIATKFAFAGSGGGGGGGGGQPSILVHKYTQSGQAVAGYQARREEDTDLQQDHRGNINTTFSSQYIHLNIQTRPHIIASHTIRDLISLMGRDQL